MSDPTKDTFQFPTAERPQVQNETTETASPEDVSEETIDNGVEESFPASDPVSVSVTKVDASKSRSKAERADDR